MSKWLQSGLRRDICVLVHALDEPTGQQLKRDLEARYEEHVRPKQFYGALDGLVEAGHLTREAEGLDDQFALTTAGERALRDHAAWLHERVPQRDNSAERK